MQQNWRKFIQHNPDILWAEALQIEKIEVNTENKEIVAYFFADSIYSIPQRQKLQELIKKNFDDASDVQVSIRWTGALEAFSAQKARHEQALRDSLVALQPGLLPYIKHIDFSIDEDKIIVTLPDDYAFSLWQMAELTQGMSAFLSDNFGTSIILKPVVQPGEFHLDIAEKPEQNELRTASAPKRDEISRAKMETMRPTLAQKADNSKVLFGKMPKQARKIALEELSDEIGRAIVEGMVFTNDSRELFDGKKLLITFGITDHGDSIACKVFLEKNDPACAKILEQLKPGNWVRVYGEAGMDKYNGNDLTITANAIELTQKNARQDTCEQKRVELHLHTQMSTMDSTLSIKTAVQTAADWGHTAMAVTDHGVVQAFPQFYDLAAKAGIKAIFGMEGYLAVDCDLIDRDQTFVVFDLETTGLSEKSCYITEIGAVKMKDGQITERFSSFINPGVAIPKEIVTLTGITDEMVHDAPTADIVLKQFIEFVKGSVLVAHNASFDMKFLMTQCMRFQIEVDVSCVDTLMLARYLLRDIKSHKLNVLTEYFQIDLENHHRADCDAQATGEVLLKLIELLDKRGIDKLPAQRSDGFIKTTKSKKRRYHIVFLVKNAQGLRNLYQLVTYSHLQHFSKRPIVPKSLLALHREGLFIGSACSSGELFDAILQKEPQEKLEEIATFYDYLEVQPVGNNQYLLREDAVKNNDELRDMNRKIIELADQSGKLCVATADVHFAEPEDAAFRAILLNSLGYKDADEQPPIYQKTTDEMLTEFAYLGEEKAKEIVITNTNLIADQCEMLRPFPKETCQPLLEGAQEELTESCYEKAHQIYGNPLPEIVQERLERELGSITGYGFSVLYVIARKLVLKSNSDGYLVGSRGSVGSSVAAFFSGITEVNALQPHYVCPNCKHSDFDVDLSQYACGCDLPDKYCPQCNTLYYKDGYNIPFETFLGFEGDKVPDIDLNFSGDYQPIAHKYTEELFGEGFVFRAGTISGVQEKTAYGYVKKFCEEKDQTKRRIEMERLALGCCGVKRTTGQHPGGIVVVPKDRDVFEFTPLHRPADKYDAPITTHFDFNSMHDTLVKLDILGHDDPTMIRMLQDLTGIDPKTIPLDDPQTMSLFSDTSALGITKEDLGSAVGTFGVPEFGTSFVRRMLVETQPKTMEELVRISGLSHGTDVWTNNAQDLVKNGTATLSKAICTRDDIMTYLIMCGVDKKMSFDIMESVRKGKGLKPEMEQAMRARNVPVWYIDSCKKIKYMFPRAHAAAYVMMAFRIAYCKVHHPLAYYATYFTIRADAFDITFAAGGTEKVRRAMQTILKKGNEMTEQEKNLVLVLEIVLEMNLRGIEFEDLDIMRSDAKKFIITENGKLLPPLSAIAGLGGVASQDIVNARASGPFTTKEDLQLRAKIGVSKIELLNLTGCLPDLPDTNQTTFF